MSAWTFVAIGYVLAACVWLGYLVVGWRRTGSEGHRR